MSLLQNIVTKVITNAVTGNQPQPQQGNLGGLLGSLAGGQNNANLGSVLGSVIASQMGGNKTNAGLGGVLGSVLSGGQQPRAGDLGSILGSVVASQMGGNRTSAGFGTQNQQGGFNKGALLLALLPIVLGLIQSNGGLSGLLAKFNNNGLGNKAQSWVNIDTNNDGLDAGDILGLFGQEQIDNVCRQVGADQSQVCQGIAELLPQVVNDLTPQGNLQNEQEANNEISEILAQFQKAF
ncbi:MAG: YidB family protein [Moraxella sp.]|nr:YidB family protein [Moraxella sp.]